MNGNTCPSSLAADFAASRGLLVPGERRQSGNSGWHYISAPSDGDSVLAVGAVGFFPIQSFLQQFQPVFRWR